MDTTEDISATNSSKSESEQTSRPDEVQVAISNNDPPAAMPDPTPSGGIEYRPHPSMIDVIKVLEKSLVTAKQELIKIATGPGALQDESGRCVQLMPEKESPLIHSTRNCNY